MVGGVSPLGKGGGSVGRIGGGGWKEEGEEGMCWVGDN